MPVNVCGHVSPSHSINRVVDQFSVPVQTTPHGQAIQYLRAEMEFVYTVDELEEERHRFIDGWDELTNMARMLDVPVLCVNAAGMLNWAFTRSRLVPNFTLNRAQLCACLILVIRREGIYRTFHESSRKCHVIKKKLTDSYLAIERRFAIDLPIITVTDFVSRYSSDLVVPEEVEQTAIIIANRASELGLTASWCLMATACGSIHLACRLARFVNTIRDLAEVSGVRRSVISTCYDCISSYAVTLVPNAENIEMFYDVIRLN